MRSGVVAFLGLALFGGGASAQPVAVTGACRTILDASERLRCYDEDANFDFSAVVRRELECDRPPRAAEILKLLIRRNVVRSLAFYVADDMNYFALSKPEKVDGLNVVAVFGFDESGQFPFVRSRGNAPGPIFGIVTRDGTGDVDRWRFRHSPGLMADDTASNIKGARDIACARLAAPGPQAGRPADDPFDAGLAPKRP